MLAGDDRRHRGSDFGLQLDIERKLRSTTEGANEPAAQTATGRCRSPVARTDLRSALGFGSSIEPGRGRRDPVLHSAGRAGGH
jgi:hypothetical protein